MILSKKFVYWSFTMSGIVGSILGIAGIMVLTLDAWFLPFFHLNLWGYLMVVFFLWTVVYSMHVYYLRNVFGENS